MNQRERTRTLQDMRRGGVRTLVATDVAARGLDVAGISHVINFDLPRQAEDYVHRIGRTGRAGASGIAVSLANHSDRGTLRQIERFTGAAIPDARHSGSRAAGAHAFRCGGTSRAAPGAGVARPVGAGRKPTRRAIRGRRRARRPPRSVAFGRPSGAPQGRRRVAFARRRRGEGGRSRRKGAMSSDQDPGSARSSPSANRRPDRAAERRSTPHAAERAVPPSSVAIRCRSAARCVSR